MSRNTLNKRASEKLTEIFSTAMLNTKEKGDLSDEDLIFLQWHEECQTKSVEYVLNIPNKDRKYSFVNLVKMGIEHYKRLIELNFTIIEHNL